MKWINRNIKQEKVKENKGLALAVFLVQVLFVFFIYYLFGI